MTQSLFETLQARFPRERSATFIETPEGRRYSYADLLGASARFARLLLESGARPGDRAIVQTGKSPQAVFLYLACLRAGLVYLPINPAYTEDEAAYFVADAEPTIRVGAPSSSLLRLDAAGARPFTLDETGEGSLVTASARLDPHLATAPATADDVAAILYTSGTTGRPKGAMLTHRNLASNALALHRIWGFEPGDVLLHALPIFHTHGLFVAINCVLLNGSGMIFLPRFDPEEAIRHLPRATVMMGVPTFYVRLLAAPRFTAEACRRMRLFISGSASLAVDTFEAFRTRTGHTILERYGMTETGMIASNPLAGERIAGAVGFPLPDVELRVCDAEGRTLPVDAVGEIELRGPNVFKGYWRKPDKTREDFRPDGFFRTGDIGRVDARGYLHIVGRSKDLIISGGLNVYPKEVERVVDAIAGIVESAVIGVPHPDFGEVVVCVATRRPDAAGLTPDSVVAEARQRLAAFKAPKAVLFIDDIPRNAMGKVEKNKLRQLYRDLFTATGAS